MDADVTVGGEAAADGSLSLSGGRTDRAGELESEFLSGSDVLALAKPFISDTTVVRVVGPGGADALAAPLVAADPVDHALLYGRHTRLVPDRRLVADGSSPSCAPAGATPVNGTPIAARRVTVRNREVFRLSYPCSSRFGGFLHRVLDARMLAA